MKTNDKEQVRKDISSSFDFVRFLIKKPDMLKKIKDGFEIHFLSLEARKIAPSMRMSKKAQAFAAETVFHTV